MADQLFFEGERQAFIMGQEHGRDNAVRLVQLLVAGIVQKYEKAGDLAEFKAASAIAEILFNYNWGLNGEKPPMPERPDR